MPDTEVLTDIDFLDGLESERRIVAAIRQGLRLGRLARFLMTYLEPAITLETATNGSLAQPRRNPRTSNPPTLSTM